MLEALSPLAIRRIADDVLQNHYVPPSQFLTDYDYAPHMQHCAWRAATDWHYCSLLYTTEMVCQYTGYTRNQMLAAMLNDSTADSLARRRNV